MLRFETPQWFLALLLIVPFLAWWTRRSYADLPRRRAWISFALRCLGVAAILAALARPLLFLRNSERAILFELDVSDSADTVALEAAWQRIQADAKEVGGGRAAGLVLFARSGELVAAPSAAGIAVTPELERRIFHRRERDRIVARIAELERSALGDAEKAELTRLQGEKQELESWRSRIGVEETDLEAALRLGRGVLPTDARARIVLASDGNATRGDALREVSALRQAGVSVQARTLRAAAKSEVLAERLLAPAEAQIRAPFDLEFAVSSNVATKGAVRVYRNKYLVAEKEVDLTVGPNLIEIPRISLEEGLHEFEATVVAGEDTVLENNVARAAVRVAGRPKVLVIDREPDSLRHLDDALAADDIQVELRPPAGIPAELNDLLDYDAIVLSDVPASAMTMAQMDMIQRYVKEFGGGLMMLGGEQSFGLGGYYRTPIEEALPVKMPIKKNVEKPNLGLVLVIDKSGSMGSDDKMELAKEAAIAAAEVLKPSDRYGVIAFDSLSEWVCRLMDAADIDSIRSMIARLEAGGGTNIYPAMYEAYQELLGSDAKLKHVILLSDGQSEPGDYDGLVGHMAADEITVSTVGIGADIDRELLERMAQIAGGEFYQTTDFSSIPQILTRETLRASKSMLVEEPFVPRVLSKTDVLAGVDLDSMPMLLGYVATQPKDTASVALVSEYGDPILATWGYGLGRAAAFTSDAKARWAGEWIGWEHFSKIWGQMVRAVMSTGTHKELQTRARVSIQDAVARVTVDVRDRTGAFRDDVSPEVSLVESDAAPKDLAVTHVAPGLFQAEFPIQRWGDFHRLILAQKRGGELVDLKALAVSGSYSPEFKSAGPDEGLLELVARETGGKLDAPEDQTWVFEGEPARTPRETWWWWLLLAALLLPLDIALRRVGL